MNYKLKAEMLKDILNIERKLVGITFTFSKKTYDLSKVKQLSEKMSYCNMVKYGTKGKSFKATIDQFFCKGSMRSLGLIALDERVLSGEEYYSYKMYDSLQTAKSVQEEVLYMPTGTYGIIVEPIECCESEPDIILMIVNPYQSMRMVQGYAYQYGINKYIKFTGNQGICSECTVAPYINKDMNISLLCANTRFSAQWSDHEMSVGLPYEQFESIVDGVVQTINSSEPDKKKEDLLKFNDKYGLNITLKSSYYKSSKR